MPRTLMGSSIVITSYSIHYTKLYDVIVAHDGSLIVVADKRQIYRSTDNAYSWELVYSAVNEGGGAQSYDLVIAPDGTLVASLTATYLVTSRRNNFV